MRKTITTTVKDTEYLANAIAKTITGGEVFALIGPLGSGKTTFTKHLAKALGYKGRVSSPTFVLLQTYPCKNPINNQKLFIHHLDLYRVEDASEAVQSGITEQWGLPQSVTVVEWADKAPSLIPKNAITIYFK